MAENTIVNGALRDCCANTDNRIVLEQNEDRKVEQCSVCQRKHYRAFVKPVNLVTVRG